MWFQFTRTSRCSSKLSVFTGPVISRTQKQQRILRAKLSVSRTMLEAAQSMKTGVYLKNLNEKEKIFSELLLEEMPFSVIVTYVRQLGIWKVLI